MPLNSRQPQKARRQSSSTIRIFERGVRSRSWRRFMRRENTLGRARDQI